MITATLVAENLSQFCPTTNLYSCADGRHLLVTVPRFDIPAAIESFGMSLPISVTHIPTHADVFLADANAVVLDADDNPANGLTPLVRVPDCDDFAQALAEAGYQLEQAS